MTDINLSRCLVEKSHIGYTEYYNICTHQVQDVVPWAAADYFGFSALMFCIALIVAAIGVMGYIAYDMSK